MSASGPSTSRSYQRKLSQTRLFDPKHLRPREDLHLGKGTFGKVYLGWVLDDKGEWKPVAVKELLEQKDIEVLREREV